MQVSSVTKQPSSYVPTFWLLLLSIFFSLSAWQSSVADETAKVMGVEDIIAKHSFVWIGEAFTDGTNKFLCIETDEHRYALWNPVDDTLSAAVPEKDVMSAPISAKCPHQALHGREVNQLLNHTMVSSLPVGGIKSHDVSDTNFGNDATLSVVFDNPSNHCGSSLKSYYTITYADGRAESFYIVTRLKKPQKYTVEGWCDGANGIKQEVAQHFDTIRSLESIALANHKTLIFSRDSRALKPIALVIERVPTSVWASDDNVFIIPQSILRPLLVKDGWQIFDLNDRYRALLSVIGKTSPEATKEYK